MYIQDLIITHTLDILCITETWLDTSIADSFIALQGYDHIRRDRGGGKGGGGVLIICS